MGARGPKPLPVNVHLLRGNPSKLPASRLLDGVHPPVEIPACPGHLQDEAKKEWRRVATELQALGLISKIDRAALSAYCAAWAEMVSAERKIAELNAADPELLPGCVLTTSTGYQQLSAWVILRNRAAERMMRFAAEFGMSPSSRSRVTASKNDGKMQSPGLDDGKQSGWGAI